VKFAGERKTGIRGKNTLNTKKEKIPSPLNNWEREKLIYKAHRGEAQIFGNDSM